MVPNFFADSGAVNCILQMEYDFEPKDVDFTLDIVDMPLWLAFHSSGTTNTIKIYKSLEVYNKDEDKAVPEATLEVDTVSSMAKYSGNDEIRTNIEAFYFTCCNIGCLIQEKNLEEIYKDLDPNKAGILLEEKDGTLNWSIVSGRERPSLAVYTGFGFGEVAVKRPYVDEIVFVNDDPEPDPDGDDDGNDLSKTADIAMRFLNGGRNTPPDPVKAFEEFKKLADAGDPSGMYNLALFYAKGHGTERSFEKAAEWMRKAAEAGDEDAAPLAEDYRKMSENIIKAENGDAQAQADLAIGYRKLAGSLEQAGAGTDYDEAVKWARLSAEQNNGDGLWALGRSYQSGSGIDYDMDKAIECFKRGAQLGNPPCKYNLGCEYLSGTSIGEDQPKGFALVKEAAEEGYAYAFKDLGDCYLHGTGCEKDANDALYWYERSIREIKNPQLESFVELMKMMLKNNNPAAGTDDRSTNNDPDGFVIKDGVIEKYNGDADSVVIPSDGSIKEIGSSAFEDRSLTGISIPASVEKIGEFAFIGSALESIEIPDGVTSIGEATFAFCGNLSRVTLSNSITSIGKGAFMGTAFETLTLPDSLQSIGESAFEGSSLTSVRIPETVTSIGDRAFSCCFDMTSITIPDSVVSIGKDAFESCGDLVITCSKGSYAYSYASENGIETSATD